MGDAKRRGSKEQRVQAAHAATQALRPEFVECGECHTHVTQLDAMDARGGFKMRQRLQQMFFSHRILPQQFTVARLRECAQRLNMGSRQGGVAREGCHAL